MWTYELPPQIGSVNEPASFNLTDFNEKSLQAFQRSLTKAQNSGQPVFPITIQSYGGNADILYGFLSVMDHFRKKGMVFVGTVPGFAASAGCMVFLYCDHRYIGPFGSLLYHSLQMSMEGAVPHIRAQLQFSEDQFDRLSENISKHLKKPKDWLKKQLKKNTIDDWTISPQEALDMKLVDAISIPEFKLTVKAEFSTSF